MNMKAKQQEKGMLLLLLDCSAMAIAMTCAFFAGYKTPVGWDLLPQYSWSIVTALFFIVLTFFIFDLYTLRRLPVAFVSQVPIILLGLLVSSIATTFVFFFFRNPVPRAVFILFYVFSLALIVLFRFAFHRMTLSSVYLKILVVCDAEPSRAMAELFNTREYLRARVVGYVSCDDSPAPWGDLPSFGGIADLPSAIDTYKIDHIVVATSKMHDDLNKLLLECMERKIRISDYRWITEVITGKVPIDYLDDYWFTLSLSHLDNRYFWYVKRTVDIFVSVAGLMVFLPVFLVAALCIKLETRGPVFYSQLRMGKGNKPFHVWKLRTMTEGADKNNVHWTLDHDDRITRVGKLLRKLRVDEAPQLFNILIGEMTLIGPRPEAISLVERYEKEIPYYRQRHMVTPGLTGWAQINYRYGNTISDTREKLKFDFYYIKHRGFILDTVIFLKTIRTVLSGKGAL